MVISKNGAKIISPNYMTVIDTFFSCDSSSIGSNVGRSVGQSVGLSVGLSVPNNELR